MSSLSDRRSAQRSRLPVEVQCRIAPGRWPDVWLTEVSLTGGQLRARDIALFEGNRIVIGMKELEGLGATVVWKRGSAFGVRFDRPLHEAVHRFLMYGPLPTEIVRESGFTDNFGRSLPAWPDGSGRRKGI